MEDRPRYVVASGSLSPGIPDDFYARTADIVKRLGAKFVLDTSGPSLEAALKKGVYLFKPNMRELRELAGHPLTNEASWISACRKLILGGTAEAVALTLGDQGALLVTKQGAWRARGLEIEVRSTVGAGDSFLGAMVSSLACGQEMEEAFRYGGGGGLGGAAVAGHGPVPARGRRAAATRRSSWSRADSGSAAAIRSRVQRPFVQAHAGTLPVRRQQPHAGAAQARSPAAIPSSGAARADGTRNPARCCARRRPASAR